MKNKSKSIKKIYLLFIPLCLLIVLGGIFLPHRILILTSNKSTNKVITAPSEYYSGAASAIAKNASSKLSTYQKAMLISGIWSGNRYIANINESNHTELDIVNIAKDQIQVLYENNLYPASLDSAYGNWFSWTANFYKSIDSTFNTYTSYFWIINFTRYDENETHKILITDNGKILAAEYYGDTYASTSSYTILQHIQSLFPDSYYYSAIMADKSNITDTSNIFYSDFTDLNLNEINKVCFLVIGSDDMKNLSDFRAAYAKSTSSSNEFYYFITTSSKNKYSITLIPYTE